MKHIVFVVGYYKNGGVPMRSTNLANEFARHGYRCTILATKEIAENVFFDRHENVELVSLDSFVSDKTEKAAVKRIQKKRNSRIRILKFLRIFTRFIPKSDQRIACIIRGMRHSEKLAVYMALNPDSIYIPFGIDYYEQVYSASYKIGCKIVYAERNAPELEFPADEIKKQYIFNIVSKSDAAVLQTEDELEFFEGRLKNSAVIHNPVKYGLPEPFNGERRKVVVNFCRIANQKNLPLLVDSFVEFQKKCPEYKLEIYGNTVGESEENILEDLKQYVKSLNAEDYISFLPPRADVHSVVRDCAMFVSSSDFEGLSNSMIEAMALGLPCICTDCLGGGAREMIKNNNNGILVPMKNKKALADAMLKMATDVEFSQECSKNASKVRDELSVSEIAKKWIAVIESVCME